MLSQSHHHRSKASQDVNTLQQNLSQKTYELEALKKSYSQAAPMEFWVSAWPKMFTWQAGKFSPWMSRCISYCTLGILQQAMLVFGG